MILVQLLGGACLYSGEAPLTGPPAQRHRIALLALLAEAWPQPLARDRAMLLLWPEKDTASARRLLNLAVYVLRSALGEATIVSTNDGLLFDPSRLRCDLHELRAAVASNDLDGVARVYTGPLLDGFHLPDSAEFGYWLDERRSALANAYTKALLALAERQGSAGDTEGRVATCRRLVAADPHSGVFAMALMRALDAAGERAAAVRHASEHAQRLRSELDLDPDADVVALADELRRPASPRARVAPAPAPLPGPRAPRAAPIRRSTRWRAAAVVGLVAIGGYVGVRRLRAPAEAPPASAAVLPFADLSPAHDQAYFSDGLTDELITTLSKVPGLRVAARTSSFQFKNGNPDVHDVGRRLDVGAVLEGSVRRSGNRLRVSAQLISTRDGYQLWSESYDRDMSDIFAVQEDVARSIVGALRVRLAPARDSVLATRPTNDLVAYDLYLKGLFTWNQRTGPALRDAVRYLEQATARDSSFARAWAALADAYILEYPYGGGGSFGGNWEAARAAAHRALALDPTSAEAYTALGYGSMVYAWDWAAAEANFRRAIAADPNYAVGHHWYGDFLAGRGRFAESFAQFSVASRLDPMSRQIGTEWGWLSYLMHRDDEAVARIGQMQELDPNYAQADLRLGFVEIQQRRYPEAIASLHRAIDLGVFRPQGEAALAYAYAASGERAKALTMVHDLERRHAEREFVPPWAIAVAYAGLGDRRRGIAWLERGIDEKDIYMPENFFDPLLDPLRSDPGYPGVEARMGIARRR